MNTAEWIVLITAAWIACAVFTTGTTYAYFYGAFPTIRDHRVDLGKAILFGLVFGPVGVLISVFMSGFLVYGWRVRPEHEVRNGK